jgi:tetratricopeptide (TPR) repeat protein
MRLAIALESSPRPDAEALAVHFAAAGERIRAAEFASEAASRASEALAFDRAARLYRLAIELTTARVRETEDLERTGDRRVLRFLYAHLGDALANAGRGAEAAAAYLQATARAPAAEVLELRRRAASQLLLSGHFSDGIAAMREVLASVGMRFTETPTETITALLWRRARIRMRGLGYKRRDVSQVPQEQLTRIDVADGASTGLGMVDSMRAASFQAQHLLLALEAGEPRRVARALSAEACFHSMRGIRTAKRCEHVLGLLGALAEELDTPEIRAQHEGSVGLVAFQFGQWARSLEYCQRAETIFRDRLTGFRWELSTTQIFAIYAESLLGRIRAFRLRLPAILKEAGERGDLYTQTVLQTAVSHTAWLTEGQPAKARQQVAEALARWNVPDTMHLQHFNATMSEISIDMYNGDGVAAYDRVTRAWKQFESSLLMYVQTLRVSAHFARGRAAVAATRAGRKGLLRGAARDARVLQRQKAPYAVGLGTMVEAGATLLSGNLERGAAALRRAAEACDKAEMSLHAEAARWELGRVIGGDEGAALVAAAERALTAEGVRDPAAMVVTFTGGLTR